MVIANQAWWTTGTFTLVSVSGCRTRWEESLRHMACNKLSSSELEPLASTAIWPFVFLAAAPWLFSSLWQNDENSQRAYVPPPPNVTHIPVVSRKWGDGQRKGAHWLSKSWGLKAHILLEERVTHMQSKLSKPAVVAFGDLSAEVVHGATGSLSFPSHTETGIIIFTVHIFGNYYRM